MGMGNPMEIVKIKKSYTGQYLMKYMISYNDGFSSLRSLVS